MKNNVAKNPSSLSVASLAFLLLSSTIVVWGGEKQIKKTTASSKENSKQTSYPNSKTNNKGNVKAKITLLPTGYAGVFKIDVDRLQTTDVGMAFELPQYLFSGFTLPKVGKPKVEEKEQSWAGRFVDTISIVTLIRTDREKGNPIFCFNEKREALAKSKIEKGSLFIIEDTNELTTDGERTVLVRAKGSDEKIYEALHRAPQFKKTIIKSKPNQDESSGSNRQERKILEQS